MQPGNAQLGPVVDAQNRLRQDFKSLAQQWSATKEQWRDERREQFEREQLQALGPSLARLCAAVDAWRDFVVKCERELTDSVAAGSDD